MSSFLAGLFAGPLDPATAGPHDFWVHRAPITSSGTRVSEQTALTLTSVYRAVTTIADAVSKLPIDVFRREGERRIAVPDHPVAIALNEPNPHMTSVVLRGTTQAHTLLWGNGFQEIQRTEGGVPAALWPLLPDRTQVQRKNLGATGRDRAITVQTNIGGKTFEIDPKNVIHIPALGFDGLRGHSPIAMARQAVGLGLALEEFGSKFFGNDAKSGGFLKHPGKLSEEAHKNIADSMERRGGLDNAHRVKILEEGMEFQQTTIPPEDAQFLLTRQFQIEEIARLFGMPLHMLQSQSKSTSWGTGVAQMSLGFLIYTLEPWIIRWEQEYDKKLLSGAERRAGFFVRHNVNALLRTDPKGRGEYYAKALNPQSGWMNRNEVRDLEDLNPDEGTEGIPEAPIVPTSPT